MPSAQPSPETSSARSGWRAKLRAIPGFMNALQYLRALWHMGSFRTEMLARLAVLETRTAALEATTKPGHADLPEDVYVALEDSFRGARADIAVRQNIYLPHIRSACEKSGLPVIDIGCGRGEWLELLKKEGIVARGVDTNAAMANHCRARGLDVTEGDALSHLRGIASGSLGAVTAFHVVEHLTTGALWKLLSEAWRAVAPGGVLILETPNPENLQVAAYSFRMDPSHVQPLPPPLLKFLAGQAGFRTMALPRHAPWPELAMDDGAYPPYLRKLLFGAQDYAIVAIRDANTRIPYSDY